MVTRKTSLPYPASPPPPPPPPGLPTQPSHHDFDSADVPAPPNFGGRQAMSAELPRSPNYSSEMSNPWSEDYQPVQRGPRASGIPSALRPGGSDRPEFPQSALQQTPEILRPEGGEEHTPRSSMDSDRDRSPEREWWDDDGEEQEQSRKEEEQPAQGLHVVNDTPSQPATEMSNPRPQIKRKPVQSATSPPLPQIPQPITPQYTGTNPFRRPSASPQGQMVLDHQSDRTVAFKDKGRADHPSPLRSLSSDRAFSSLNIGSPSSDKEVVSRSNPNAPPLPAQAPPPIPQLQPPLIPLSASTPVTSGPVHQKSNERLDINPWNSSDTFDQTTPSPAPFDESKQFDTIPTTHLLKRPGQRGSLSLAGELDDLPDATSTATDQATMPTIPPPQPPPPQEPPLAHLDPSPIPLQEEHSLLEDDSIPRPPPRHRSDSGTLYAPPVGPPPPRKPPRPAVVVRDQDLDFLQTQRSETYTIKHFDWYDVRTSSTRRSSMLVQNRNGPCPLLALVNALILGATESTQAALDDALRAREQVSLGLIIETLMDELLTLASMNHNLELPDVDELNRFLMRLRTGMNANPRFVSPPQNLMDHDDAESVYSTDLSSTTAGSFEPSVDLKLYSSFGVKLIHGWLPQPDDMAYHAFLRSAQTYEDAQALQFGEEELEYKLEHGGLSPQEQRVWEDITSIKQFLRAYPTQLTLHGLATIKSALSPGEFAILFRNDHFSTIFKNSRDGKLYTLVTDLGYADNDSIIWESLEDISGSNNKFFTGEFEDSSTLPTHSSTTDHDPYLHIPDDSTDHNLNGPLSPAQVQEQADADFAMALHLQEEEEREQASRRAARAREAANTDIPPERPARPNRNPTGNANTNTTRQNTNGGIPIGVLASSRANPRPQIPPRNPPRPLTNRPSDALDPDAPPAYEEAASRPAYVPPLGSPLHPSSTSLPLHSQATASTSSVNVAGNFSNNARDDPASRMLGRQGRTGSAYGENSENWGTHGVPEYSSRTARERDMNMPGSFAGSGGAMDRLRDRRETRRLQRQRGNPGQDGEEDERDCVVM